MGLNIKKAIKKKIANYRKAQLINSDFSIISNNCWGSFTYQYFNLPYNTPFVGLFIFSPDYLELLKDLKGALDVEIGFISPANSKYKEILKMNGTYDTYPIGVLGEIEIHFLHYASEEEARTKWNRRKIKVNFENLVVKYSEKDLATDAFIVEFNSMDFERKVLLTAKKRCLSSEVNLKNERGVEIRNEWNSYLATVNPVLHLNSLYK